MCQKPIQTRTTQKTVASPGLRKVKKTNDIKTLKMSISFLRSLQPDPDPLPNSNTKDEGKPGRNPKLDNPDPPLPPTKSDWVPTRWRIPQPPVVSRNKPA